MSDDLTMADDDYTAEDARYFREGELESNPPRGSKRSSASTTA